MLLTHVQAYTRPDAAGGIHIQATGPGFPTGYTSCDLTTSLAYSAVKTEEAATTKRFPSFRLDSDAKYILCTIDEDGDVACGGLRVCDAYELVEALGAPSPAYDDEVDTTVVSDHVRRCVDAAQAGSTATGNVSELTELREQVRAILSRLDDLID